MTEIEQAGKKIEVLWPITGTTERMASLAASLQKMNIVLQGHGSAMKLVRCTRNAGGGPDTDLNVAVPESHAFPFSLLAKKFAYMKKLMEVLEVIQQPADQTLGENWSMILDGTRRNLYHHYKFTRLAMEFVAKYPPSAEDPLPDFLKRWLWQEYSCYNHHHPDDYSSNLEANTQDLDISSQGKISGFQSKYYLRC